MPRIDKSNLGLYFIAVALWLFLGAGRAFASGECVEGMYNAYDGDCVEQDIDAGQCTTRLEQTPPSRWCCCPDGYDPYDPKNDGGCGFSAAAKKTKAPSSTLKALRGVRDNVLAKSDKGREYVALSYKHAGAVSKIFLANPALALDGAKLLDRNLAFLTALADGGSAAISKADIEEVRSFLNRVAKAGEDQALREAIQRVSTDLANAQILQRFGVKVK